MINLIKPKNVVGGLFENGSDLANRISIQQKSPTLVTSSGVRRCVGFETIGTCSFQSVYNGLPEVLHNIFLGQNQLVLERIWERCLKFTDVDHWLRVYSCCCCLRAETKLVTSIQKLRLDHWLHWLTYEKLISLYLSFWLFVCYGFLCVACALDGMLLDLVWK